MENLSFHVDDQFGPQKIVLYVREGRQVPIEQLSEAEIETGIVLPEDVAVLLVDKLKRDGLWGNPNVRVPRRR